MLVLEFADLFAPWHLWHIDLQQSSLRLGDCSCRKYFRGQRHNAQDLIWCPTDVDGLRYRKKMRKLAEDCGLPKLTFQVIRRTIATLAQRKGAPKDIQALLRHSRVATTTDVYMQESPESVKATVEAINKELRLKPEGTEAA